MKSRFWFRVTVVVSALLVAAVVLPPIARQVASDLNGAQPIPSGLQKAMKHHLVSSAATGGTADKVVAASRTATAESFIQRMPGAVPIFSPHANQYPTKASPSKVKIVDTPVAGTDTKPGSSGPHYIAGRSKEVVSLRPPVVGSTKVLKAINRPAGRRSGVGLPPAEQVARRLARPGVGRVLSQSGAHPVDPR